MRLNLSHPISKFCEELLQQGREIGAREIDMREREKEKDGEGKEREGVGKRERSKERDTGIQERGSYEQVSVCLQ